MNGGVCEYVASYVDYGDSMSSNAKEYGKYGEDDSILGKDSTERAESTSYKTVYSADGTNQDNSYYNKAKNIKGDAIYETSNSYSNSTSSWFNADAYFPYTSSPFFLRSNSSGDIAAGTFCFNQSRGDANSYYGFRVVLVP